MSKPEIKFRRHQEDYFWHAGFHVHRLVIVVAMTGCLFNVFPLIYITNRENSHFDVPRVVTAVCSLLAYLALFFGQTLKSKMLYWVYFVVNTSLIVAWLFATICSIYFAGAIIIRLLHPKALEGELNIWWLVHVATYLTNVPQDFGRPHADIPITILLLSSALLSLFGTLFQFYFLWIAIRGYNYLTDVILDTNSELRRVE